MEAFTATPKIIRYECDCQKIELDRCIVFVSYSNTFVATKMKIDYANVGTFL